VFIVVAHERRRVVHFNVTSNPTALMREAFPDDSAPRYLLRHCDGIYGEDFREQVAAKGIREVLTAARNPWQNPFAERLIGSIRRECLDR
jgi:putative transposase